MEPVGYLDGLRSTLCNASSVFSRAISGDDLDTRMLPQPIGKSLGASVGQNIYGAALLQVNEYRTVGSALSACEIINP
jgi:hypothetical protein